MATVIAVAIGISLGQWQTRRAAEKAAIELKMTARESEQPVVLGPDPIAIEQIEYRQVLVSGEFVRDWPVYLDNRPHDGVAGLVVLMPLKLAGSDMYVLVARGWVARNKVDRTRVPLLLTPGGRIEISGLARRNAGHLLQLGSAEKLHPGAIVQNLEVSEFAKLGNMRMQPFILEQQSAMQDGLIRDWLRPSTGIDKHRGYAFQWYGLAATAFLFFVVTGFRRGKK